ncbi:MAG: tetratricopeptide repeat protein [Bacteroidales bacterium]|nr:tetratricopeptide repeat protein [Bacteroidales bacterium]NLK81080.1 tetratricopeptide repeat protein [Bacteroidales bacterium]
MNTYYFRTRFIINICFFLLCFAKAQAFSIDTCYITNKQGEPLSKDVITTAINSQNKREVGDMFYNSAYALANVYNMHPDSLLKAFRYFDVAIDFYTESNADVEKILCIEHKATIAYELGRTKQAIQLFQKAISEYELLETPDLHQIGMLYTNIAFVYFNSYRYDNALRFFSHAISLYDELNDSLNIAKSLYFKGLIFFESAMYDSAYTYYQRVLEFDIAHNNINEIIASYNNICVVLLKQKQFSDAFEVLSKVDEYMSESNNEVKAILANNKGNAYFYANDYIEALAHYQLSLKLKKESNDSVKQAITLHNIARVYSATNQIELGIETILEAESLVKTDMSDSIYAAVCETASVLFEQNGNTARAFEYYELFAKLSYSMVSHEGGQISESQVKYQDNRMQAATIQREIKMQQLLASYDFAIKRTEIQMLDEKRKSERLLLYMYIGILVFIVLAFVILLNRYRLKKRANRKLEEQNAEIQRQNVIITQQTEELIVSNTEFEKLSIVASNTDNAIIIMDKDGNFEWINDAFTKLFGFTFEQLCERISPNMISPTTPEYIKEAFKNSTQNGVTVNYDLQTKNSAGDEMWVNVTLTPIFNEQGEIHKLVMIDSDISALKRAEVEIRAQKNQIENQKEELTQQRDDVLVQSKELEAKKEELTRTLNELQIAQNKLVESEKMAALGGLVAGISHEINTPVGVGTAAATSLQTQINDLQELFESKKMKLSDLQNFIDTAQKACDLILKNLTRTAELVKSFNQVSVDNMSEQKRSFNLHEYLHDISRSLAPKLKGRKISLSIECPETIELHSYPGAFAQIFTNLIVNSLVHAFDELDEGQITIHVDDMPGAISLRYADTGKGISKENQEKIFDAFFTTNPQVGTGLGMNITYNLITQKLHGEVTLQSELGKGVVFTITIPKSQITE